MADVTVYYDGSCPLCRREIGFYKPRSDAAFVDVSEPANVPPDLSAEAAMGRFHVRRGEVLLSGAAAFAALWRATRGFRLIGRVAALPPVTAVLEVGYRGFLAVRGRLKGRQAVGEGERSPCR